MSAFPRQLLSDLRADPVHAPETFVIHAVEYVGEPARAEAEQLRAERPDDPPGAISVDVVARAVRLAAIDGGIAGTPLYIALVPAYVSMLLEQARMTLTVAALHGETAEGPEAAAEMLALRGVHPNVPDARRKVDEKLAGIARGSRPDRQGLVPLGRAMLVLAGFIEPKELKTEGGRVKSVLFGILGALFWALTWVVPVTFILVMAWSCQQSTAKLGERTLRRYGEPVAAAARASSRRQALWAAVVLASAAAPAVLLFAAARWHPLGIGEGHVVVGLLALTLVLVLVTRRWRWPMALPERVRTRRARARP